MHRRVRLLYLEFLYLLPQLQSFYTPRGGAAATKTKASFPRPFFLRVAEGHPVCALLRSLHAKEFCTRAHHSHRDDGDTIVVFKLQSSQEMDVLESYMPRGWRNGRQRFEKSGAAHTTPPLSPEAEYRAHVQRLFYANALVPVDSAEWKRCLARGRYELRGIQNVLHVRKYRALHKRYGWASQLSRPELEAVWAGDMAQVEQALLGLSNRDVYGYAGTDREEDGDGEDEEGAVDAEATKAKAHNAA
ncbi:hypothetical protein NQL31_002772 [Lotmaria passim]